jgi:hypothetical protein
MRLTAYLERSLLITLGGTVTVLAGFLSQVWGGAGIPFRTELAQMLVVMGTLFTVSFALPGLRTYAEWPENIRSGRGRFALMAWLAGISAGFLIYLNALSELGQIILRYAKMG